MKRIYYETAETITRSKKGYIEVDDSYTQVYDSLFKLSFKLKSITEVNLLFYLCTIANDSGVFNSDERLYNSFCKQFIGTGKEAITRQTFTNCIKSLLDAKILIKLGKGQYQLNPLVIWRDSVNERELHLKELFNSTDEVKYKLEEPFVEYIKQ